MEQVTQWFEGCLKPKRVGVYQRMYLPHTDVLFCFFDGDEWRTNGISPCDAATKKFGSLWQDEPWRGLANQP